MLRQLHEIETPAWLADLTAEKVMHAGFPISDLLPDSLYYPSSGFDADPIKHFGGNVLSFIYADYGLAQGTFINALHFSGYAPIASRHVSASEFSPGTLHSLSLLPIDGDPYRYQKHIHKPYGIWTVFQRRSDVQVTHGPLRFSLLFICADAVTTFQELYVSHLTAPKAIAVIQPGHAFGYNWTDFTDSKQIFARLVLGNPAGLPEMLLFGGNGKDWSDYATPCWPTHKFLTRRFKKTRGGTVGIWSKNSCELVPRKSVNSEQLRT
jgi:hypothetical protein